MPESGQDYSTQIASLERKFRMLKRNIINTAAEGKVALEDPGKVLHFEARLEAAITDFADLQRTWQDLWSVHILAGSSPDDDWEKRYDLCRNEVIKAKSILMEIQRKQAKSDTSEQFKSDCNRSVMNTTFAAPARPHLFPISVPQFSGDILKWTHFRDTFQSLVHNDPVLTDIERFHYLLGALSGEAATLVSRFTIEEKSYSLAWKKLKENYDNPRVLASLFIQQILDNDTKGMKTELQRYEHFLTNVADSIEGFRSLSLENPAEFLLASLALKALDPQTRRNFELARSSSTTFPNADDVINFVRQRKTAVTMSRDIGSASSTSSADSSTKRTFGPRLPNRRSQKYSSVAFHSSNSSGPHSMNSPNTQRKKSPAPRPQYQNQANSSEPQTCPFCQANHTLSRCFKFSNATPEDRIAFVRCLKCCRNCLHLGHLVADCKSKWTCRFCKMKHHSLIHGVPEAPHQNSSLLNNESPSDASPSQTFSGFGSNPISHAAGHHSTLLGTAEILIVGDQGHMHPARAILDSGSQQTFISLAFANKIGLSLTDYKGNITGLGGCPVSKPSGTALCQVKSKHSTAKFITQAVVVDRIAPPLPNFTVPHKKVQKLLRYMLADQHFHTPGPIDVLIGMDLYPLLITGTPYHSGVDQLFLLPTIFGLVVIGKLSDECTPQSVSFFTESRSTIEENLKAFWEIEEPKPVDRQNPHDVLCEEHFNNTTSRMPDGRYMVRLPLLPAHDPLGRNRELVTKRFLNLERKFTADPLLNEHYKDFMQEYEALHHMSPATCESSYLIPHHGVWQEGPSSRKLRVVFDASCTSTTSQSLNSILMAGPKLQADIGEVLINFRLHRIPVCADLVKMYRQILIHPDDRHLQHVLWRTSQCDAIVEMELNTVTYGVRPSAYQAQRVIKQLALDEGAQYPLALKAISTSMYVDDIASGANTVEEAKELQNQMIALFAKGGFSLSKWASTAEELVPADGKIEPVQLNLHDSKSMKILGLIWNPLDDSFSYSVSQPPTVNATKRSILSAIARIFDPLGLLAPIILLVKVLLQEIWKQKLEWDQALPPDISNTWRIIVNEWNLIPLYKQLSPFVDDLGIVRVGGRLQSSPLQFTSKHPILLPRSCHLSRLIISDIHNRHYHCGPSLTLALLRCEFWIPGALKLIRGIILRCVHCRLQRAKPITPIVGPLPKDRFSTTRAFLNVGVDFAGPFLIKHSNLRKAPVTKAYLCLFICLSTKAVHLETVSSLSTEAFLAALDRFVARRGLPSVIWSDRGTNFVGASTYIKDCYKFLSQNEEKLMLWSVPNNVTWKFNPPHAPHFGGIWEAGVKSVKTLLMGSVASQPYTFEELSTTFTRIEQLLNSRPLCPLNEDHENCGYLTPAHFIVGESLGSIPEVCNDSSLKSPRSRWEAVQAHIRHIWDRWRLEYLHTLQQRRKWHKDQPNVKIGQLVILTERRTIVGQWPVGRIVDVHPGHDGVVRTVSVRTPSGKVYVRPVVALAPLFFEDEDSPPPSNQQM